MNDNNWTIPNVITIARIIMVPMFVVAYINHQLAAALLIFVLAGVSDGLDGFLARILRQRSKLGALLDPLADKLLLVTAYICLGFGEMVASWLAVLVVSRDLMLIGGMALLQLWGVNIRDKIRPTWLSKFNTCVQILLVVVVLTSPWGWAHQGLLSVLAAIVATSTLLSGGHYIYIGLGLFPRGE